MHGTNSSAFYAIILVIIVVFILALIICWGFASNCSGRRTVFYECGDVWRGSGFQSLSTNHECGKDEHIKTLIQIKRSNDDLVCLDYNWKVMDCKNVVSRGKKRFQGTVGRFGTLYLKEVGQSGTAVIEPMADCVQFSYNGVANGSRVGDVISMTAALTRDDEDCLRYW